MAGEEMTKQSSERRRSRAGLNLHVNFNGGVVLLLGAAAGALLASAFAAHRIRAHKRRRGSTKEGIQEDSGEHLSALEEKEFVGDEGGEGDGANAGEGVFQVNSHGNPDASVKISQVDQREIDFCLLEERKGEIEERSSTIDIVLVDGELGELAGLRESSADISSSPANTCNNLGEKQLRYDDEAASVEEECKASCVNCKEDDEEDNEKAYIEEWDERDEIEENMNSSVLHSEQPRLLEKKISQNSEMVIATGVPGDQDEMNPLIEEREAFFEESGEAKKALDITQNDSGKHPDMVIMEDGIRKDCVGFKEDERLDILCVQQDIEEKDAYDGKMVEGSRDLCEQTVSVSHESSFTAITEPEFLLHGYICDNPTMIVAVEEKTQLEDNTICDLNDVIQEEKTEENLLNGLKENVESYEAEENLRENEECSLKESLRIEFSLEHDNLMACKENPLIQFQRIEPIVREEKACLDDRFPVSIDSNLKTVQPIQGNNSEKTLEIEESHMEAGAEDSKTSPDEEVEEREDDAGSVQNHELETRQNIEAHRDKLERQIEKEEAEIHKESGAQIKEEENEDQEQILKLSFDPLEKGAKQDTKTALIDKDGDKNTVSSKGKQKRIATKEMKRREYIFLLMTVATAFAVLAFLYTKDFMRRTAIFENFIKS